MNLKEKRVLVTGGAGFIGSEVDYNAKNKEKIKKQRDEYYQKNKKAIILRTNQNYLRLGYSQIT